MDGSTIECIDVLLEYFKWDPTVTFRQYIDAQRQEHANPGWWQRWTNSDCMRMNQVHLQFSELSNQKVI